MSRIAPLLIVMLALVPLAVTALPSAFLNPDYNLSTTSSIVDFLNDSWTPPAFEPEVMYAAWPDKNNVTQNSTPTSQLFLNDSYTTPPYEDTTQSAVAQNKDKQIATSVFAIHQFLQDDWTPGATLPVVETSGYTLKKPMA